MESTFVGLLPWARAGTDGEGLGGLPPVNDHPGVDQLTALAFAAAIDDPSRIRRSREMSAPIWAWFQGAISRARSITSAASRSAGIGGCGPCCTKPPMTRYKGQLKLEDWAFAIAKRSTMRKTRIALARRLAIIMHATLRDESRLKRFRPISLRTGGRIELPQGATPEGGSRRRRGLCCSGQLLADCDFNLAALHPAYPIKCRTSAERTQAPESVDTGSSFCLDLLENSIRRHQPVR
jgi:hypothetical protein